MQENLICHLFSEDKKLKAWPRPRSCCHSYGPYLMYLEFSCTCSDSGPPWVHLWWIFFLAAQHIPRNNAGFSVSDSIANKVFITFLSFACVGTYVLGVFLINQALKTPLVLLILSLFCLENTHPIKILLTLSFFSRLLHSEAPFSIFGATADSTATFPAIHPPQVFKSFCLQLCI